MALISFPIACHQYGAIKIFGLINVSCVFHHFSLNTLILSKTKMCSQIVRVMYIIVNEKDVEI